MCESRLKIYTVEIKNLNARSAKARVRFYIYTHIGNGCVASSTNRRRDNFVVAYNSLVRVLCTVISRSVQTAVFYPTILFLFIVVTLIIALFASSRYFPTHVTSKTIYRVWFSDKRSNRFARVRTRYCLCICARARTHLLN